MSAPPARRGLVRKVLIATLLGALVFCALALYGDVSSLRAHMRHFVLGSFAVAVALASGNFLLRFVRWQYYLRCIDVKVPPVESALVFLGGFVMGVTPGKIGEVFKSLLLYESRGIAIARTAPVVVAERLTDLIALVVLIAIASGAFARGLAVTIVSAIAVAAIAVVCAHEPTGRLVLALLARVPLVRRAVPRLREAYEALRLLTRPMPLVVGSAIGALAWSLECVALFVVLGGFAGVKIGLQAAVFAYAAATIGGALAMMPGGLGVTEASMTGLLLALGGEGTGMTRAIATAATILVRLATLWYSVAVGIAALAGLRAMLARRRPVEISAS